MNALVKKEIRLLLPGWLAILLLEVLQPWFWQQPDGFFGILPFIFFFGIIILAVDSFGREFSLGTFQSLLAQPVERRRIWQTKTTILFFATTLIFAAYVASCKLRLDHGLKNPAWNNNPGMITDFHNAMCASAVAALVALVGGLWTALLFRQTATAFWISFLAPAGLGTVIEILLPAKLAENEYVVSALLYGAAGAYIIFGFWLAHRLFHRAQDVAWTGGVISFSKWRYFEAVSQTSVSLRRRKPISALLKKEFQLHSITLFCAGTLLVLHLAVFFLRIFYVNGGHKNSFADGVSMFFWTLWLVLPLTLGCMTVAEERKLGVTEGQFCLPASRRLQFVIKFIPSMIFGVLLGGVMPVLLEGLAAHFGAPSEFFKPDGSNNGITGFQISIIAASAGLSLAAFFASTVARNFLQALSIAIVIIVGSCVLLSLLGYVNDHPVTFPGIRLWPMLLAFLIAIPTMAIVYLWLVYRNFNHFYEAGQLWRRNITGTVGGLLFAFVISVVIYNRVWEVFEPVEPPHGAAKLSLSNPPKVHANGGITVVLPDGRAWLDYAGINFSGRFKDMVWLMLNPLPRNEGPAQFIQGSNWAQVMTDAGRTIGIKSDGTLWISPTTWKTFTWPQMPIPPQFQLELTNATGEADWRTMDKRGYYSGQVYLLKTNHTLWEWSAMLAPYQKKGEPPPPSLPIQVGTNSDWAETFSSDDLCRKIDGTVWRIGWEGKTNKMVFDRETNLDEVDFQTLSHAENGEHMAMAYIGKDERLMVFNWHHELQPTEHPFLPCGNETNWVAVSVEWHQMTALKSDGTLWHWQWDDSKSISDTVPMQPARLGIHNDWVAITDSRFGTISLAADGSLWLWPDADFYYEVALLKLPKQPQLLGNIFGKAD